MIESEGITENVKTWRTDISKIAKALPMERARLKIRVLRPKAADPKVFAWWVIRSILSGLFTRGRYIREFEVYMNLFVDHSHVVQLTCLRRGIWDTSDV